MTIEGKDQESKIREAMRNAQGGGSGQREQEETRGGESRRSEARRPEGGARHVSLANIGRINQMPIAMSNTAEALEQFRRDFVEAMPSKDDNNMLAANVFPIDASTAGIPFSLVVVAATKRGNEAAGVGYHTFLLAGSAETLRPREESARGQRLFIVQVPGDGYDDRTRTVVKQVLERHFPGQPLLSGDAEVIAEGFPSAKEDPQAIADCVKNAFAAIKTAIDRNDPNVVQLQLSADEANETYNTVHVQHRQNHIYDRGHMPVRADVIIDLQSREGRSRANNRDSIDQLVAGTRISRIGGYYDVIYAPHEDATTRNDLYGRGRDDRRGGDEYRTYALRFITTFADTIDFSPTTMLLAQATMNAAGDSAEVMRAFEPNQSVGEDDMRNIGALAIEPNLAGLERGFGERYETKNSGFTTAKRQALLRAVLRPGVVFSIDVPECGASTWQHIDLMAASQGNQKAMSRLYDAACYLTDGHFEDLYGRNDPIVDSHVERIHAGYYTEGSGGARLDLRDFDYIALLNLLRPEKEEDLTVIQKWSMAAAISDDTLLSQSERFEIIRDFVPTAVVTGYHQRFNFNIDWNLALMEAISRCKLSLNPTSSTRDGHDRFRTTYGNIDQILNRPGSGRLFANQRSRDRGYDDRYDSRGTDRFHDRW